MNEPTHLDLFSGIGGFALAARWAGFRTVAFCEIDHYCRRVLREHWPDTRCFTDVRDIYRFAHEYELCPDCEEEPYCERHEKHFGDCACYGCSEWDDEMPGIDLLTAGVPCQPASLIGQRRGTGDQRWLWPEAIRIVGAIQPKVCIFENPRAILSLDGGRAFLDILNQLAQLGYDLWWEPVPAYALGAGHRRERIFLLAAHADRKGLEGYPWHDEEIRKPIAHGPTSAPDLLTRKLTSKKWYAQSSIQPVVDGLPSRLVKDQLTAIGNSIVPQVAFHILKPIHDLIHP